ncbi:MAG: arylsulfotransferase family protein [Pseudomonadota bacterium]
MMDRNSLPLLVSLVCAVTIFVGGAFGAGFAVAYKQYWPFEVLRDSGRWIKSQFVEGGEGRVRHQTDSVFPGGLKTWERLRPSASSEGIFAIVSYNPEVDSYTLRFWDGAGALLHEVDVNEILAGISDEPGFSIPHGFEMLSDGSFIVNYIVHPMMARLDICGEVMWTNIDFFHHSLALTERGTAWTWRGAPDDYALHQFMEEFDIESGEVVRSVPLEDVVIAAGENAAYLNRRPEPFPLPPPPGESDGLGDAFHPNDVEELPSSMAAAFPQFEAGDLLISLKSMNLVAVVGPDQRDLKWFSRGPWSRQHDPDWVADGTITVFDNNYSSNYIKDVPFGTSSIVSIDPKTNAVKTLVQDGEVPFQTEAMGKHEWLPSGSVLVVSSHEGRVIEYTSDGVPLTIFNNISTTDPTRTYHVAHARWLPADFLTDLPSCAPVRLEQVK